MSTKRFWDDPYLAEFQTRVSAVSGNRITLTETIFYAFSGGQESDEGTIGEFPVLKAEKQETEIWYELPENHHLSEGDEVKVSIDWERRYRLMRLHFAAELVLVLVSRMYPGIEKIGAHISGEKARLDFFLASSIASSFEAITREVAGLVATDSPIISAFSDEEKERRYWEIEDFARVPCGGTHLRTTGEVGVITLKRKNIGKGKERLEIYLTD